MKTYISTRILASIGVVITALIVVAVLLFLRMFYSVNTITLEELGVETCDQLPTFSEVDALFMANQSMLSEFLDDLSECQNNVSVCEHSSKCKNEDYSKQRISSGNTSIEWKKIPECNNKKGAIKIAHTSACEIIKIGEFMDQNPEFANVPSYSINY